MGTHDPDAQRDVLLRATRGDRKAFEEIVAWYHLDLLRLSYVICGDRALAEDAVQNAWHRAWRKLDQVRDSHALKGWLLAIAGNEARRGASKIAPYLAESNPDALLAPDEGVADRAVTRADLRAAVAQLDPLDRQIIALRYLMGATAAEIGQQSGLSAEGARTRLHRALQKLRQGMTDG